MYTLSPNVFGVNSLQMKSDYRPLYDHLFKSINSPICAGVLKSVCNSKDCNFIFYFRDKKPGETDFDGVEGFLTCENVVYKGKMGTKIYNMCIFSENTDNVTTFIKAMVISILEYFKSDMARIGIELNSNQWNKYLESSVTMGFTNPVIDNNKNYLALIYYKGLLYSAPSPSVIKSIITTANNLRNNFIKGNKDVEMSNDDTDDDAPDNKNSIIIGDNDASLKPSSIIKKNQNQTTIPSSPNKHSDMTRPTATKDVPQKTIPPYKRIYSNKNVAGIMNMVFTYIPNVKALQKKYKDAYEAAMYNQNINPNIEYDKLQKFKLRIMIDVVEGKLYTK